MMRVRSLMKRLAALVLALIALLPWLCKGQTAALAESAITRPQQIVDYLDEFGELPPNFITKSEAKALGWENGKNNLSKVAPGYSIGGDKFQNREKLLPEKAGRTYRECDCNYVSGKRTSERLVYSNDGLYFYTDNGYRSFRQMYPSEKKGQDDPDPDRPIIEPQEIADYLFEHGELPPNFITKDEARDLGWDSRYNDVSDVAPGYSIGGDRFGNYEGKLPRARNRQYYECDCYYTSGNRGAYRLVYSNDGLVYYTDDHYQTFTRLYPSR